jgi:crotonobetainyl-CoA:carnitine CoA-transferase CaiB-like acyl-CoA transferase
VDGTPKYLGSGLADQVGAMWLAFGMSMALHARDRLGIAQRVDTSQLGSVVALQGMAIDGYLMYGREPAVGARTAVRNPLWNSYRDSEGKWFVLACLQPDQYWGPLCRVIGRPELENDPRFNSLPAREQHAEELVALLDAAFATRCREEWLAELDATGMMVSQVSNYADIAVDPQVVANEFITTIDHPNFGNVRIVGNPVHLSQTPPNAKGYAPELGQHTEEVLLAHGYTWDDLTGFREAGVI